MCHGAVSQWSVDRRGDSVRGWSTAEVTIHLTSSTTIEQYLQILRDVSRMSLLPYVCFLVNSVERVGDFLIEVFGCTDDQSQGSDKPVLHRLIQLSLGSSVTIVQKDSCDAATLATFNLYAVKHFFISVRDLEKVRSIAVKLGAQVTRDDLTERITICFLDGVDEITIHATDAEKNKKNPHDIIMNAMLAQSHNVAQEVIVAGTGNKILNIY